MVSDLPAGKVWQGIDNKGGSPSTGRNGEIGSINADSVEVRQARTARIGNNGCAPSPGGGNR